MFVELKDAKHAKNNEFSGGMRSFKMLGRMQYWYE